jgi:hypothetical protein
MSNSIVTPYAQHRAAVTGGTADRQGGESADWPELAQALVDILIDRLGELPLDPPLRYGWPYEIAVPNGVWPNLIIVHDGSTPTDTGSSGYIQWWHEGQAVLLFGTATDDPAVMRRNGQPYLYPMWRVLRANQDLERRCRSIEIGRQTWGTLPIGQAGGVPRRWYGLTTPFVITGDGGLWTFP